MDEREWPEEETGERLPAEPADDVEIGRTAGGADPVTGDEGPPDSSNADIPAA